MKTFSIYFSAVLVALLLSNTGCTTRTTTTKKGMSGISSTAHNTKARKDKEKKAKSTSKGFKLPFSDN